jgi:hypothetical protein
MELRELLAADHGIADAEALRPRLPLLLKHPAVLSRMPQTGGRPFQRGLEQALGKAIESSGEPDAMQRALRWQLALDKEDPIEAPNDRRAHAAEIVEANENDYWKDRAEQKLPKLTVALESIEAQLEILGQASLGRPSVKVGGVKIPDILLLAACSQGQDATKEMTLEFEDTPRDKRPDCEEWPLISALLLTDLKREAKDQGRTFRPGPALDLVCAEALEPEPGAPRRYRIGVAETDYNRWAATANSLDRDLSRHRELTERLGSNTLRQAWGHAPNCLEDIAELPAPCFMGVCVVVVVENRIVVLPRQRLHLVAGSEPSSADRSTKPTLVHFVGEGVEPGDVVAGRTPPENAALRGCYEELKLAEGEVDLIPTAFVFDTLRWQPLFCYLAYCKLTMSEVETRMKQAEQREETGYGQIAALLPPTITAPETRALLAGSDPSMRLASNHAEIALLYALVYTDGLERVAAEAP